MKITFISTVNELSALSSRSLCAYVRSLGHAANIIYLPTPVSVTSYSETVLDQVSELLQETEIIGISVITPLYFPSVQLTKVLRQKTNAKVLWGGIHATVRPEQCLEHADFVCVGEGELVLKELLRDTPVASIPGLWYKEGDEIIKNGISPMLSDLSLIPFQDFTFDNHYLIDPIHPANAPERLTKEIYYERCNKKYQNTKGEYKCFYKTMTSRGCPFSCTYCNNSVHHSMYTVKHFRKRLIGQVIKELEMVCKANPFIEFIHFADDNFLARSTKEIIRFCDMYKKVINLPFRLIASADTLNDEKLSHLISAGLCDVCMGIQSGSDNALKRYNRTIKKETILEAAKLLNRYKKSTLPPRYDVICNDPFSTPEEKRETVLFLAKLPKPRIFVYFNLVLFPGTQINTIAVSRGLLTDEVKGVYESNYEFKASDYYDLLLTMLNLEYVPRWSIRFLSLLPFYNLTIRFPILNKVAYSTYEKVIVKANLLIHLLIIRDFKTVNEAIKSRFQTLKKIFI